jgi:ABC-type multidrug transport system ATPase subunit/ABC-type multidrug transport system permease subunit
MLRDLNSFNGSFVNGHRVSGLVRLNPGDEVIFGNQTFMWDGLQMTSRATRRDLTLFAENVTTVVKGGKRLLDGVSFNLEPSSLTAVIGPSGAGKSTLLGALTGLQPATHGNVVWQGHDLYTHYDQLRFQIGLVPQQDIQHPQLTVRQGLTYAAELRLPPDTNAEERARRVGQVVGQLQLGGQIDNRIGTQLSGGQRKRVSIATELLTAPPLLFLDEPTSGLDPGLDRDVMHQLRTLANEGRVVVVVTHSVLALDVCDNVVVLAPGGRLAYFGPPSGVLQHFGCRDYPEVFDLLDEPDLWQRIPPPAAGHLETGRLPALNVPVAPPPHQSLSRQLSTLTRRNLAVTLSDRLLLGMLLALPLVLGVLSRVVQGTSGLSISDTASDAASISSAEAVQRLTILVVAAALMGTAVTIRELVKERAIFQREYAVGLSPDMYLLSKLAVLGTAAFLQGVLVTFLATVGMPGPDDGGVFALGWFEVALAVGALGFTMAVVGLAVSAVVTSSEQTMPALVGLVMVQLVLSGSLVAVDGRPVLEQVAWLAPARWGFAASAVSVDLHKPRRLGGVDTDPLLAHNAGQWLADLTALGVLCALALGLGLWLVRRSAGPARR